MGIKYYHSAPLQIRMQRVITDASGTIVYSCTDSKFVKNLHRTTICSVLDNNKLSFGYTTCAPKDVYRKKIGQAIARGRALQKPYATFNISDKKDVQEISKRIVDEIFDLETKRIYG